jgi:hypothetical protein
MTPERSIPAESKLPGTDKEVADDTVQLRRRKKILDYESQALQKSDLLQANLELCCGDLMSLMAQLRDDTEAVLATIDDPAERAAFLCNIVLWHSKASKSLHLHTEFLERRTVARKQAATVRRKSAAVPTQEPLSQTGVTLKPKAK